ncbi:hypothetical protein MNBD_GAMMA09-2098, partial [hydrothermal vent metagenome]
DFNCIQAWNQFIDEELDEKWGLQYFPAWLLLKEQGLSLHLTPLTNATPEAFLALQQLLGSNNNEEEIQQRQQLQSAHEGFFKYYLQGK